MSAVLHRREINVAITGQEAGQEFANAPCDIQAAFLSGWLDAVDDWGRNAGGCSWPMQCNYIAAEFSGDRRIRLRILLGTLVEHLEEQNNE